MCTDQKCLRYLLEQRITTQNQQNWLAKLLRYEFDIIYKQGVTNKAATHCPEYLEKMKEMQQNWDKSPYHIGRI